MELPLDTGPLALRDAFARVQLADGTVYTTRGAAPTWADGSWLVEAAPPGLTVRPDGQVRLAWRITPLADGVAFGLTVTNQGPGAIAIERLDVLVAPLAGAPVASQTGWQSWSYASPPQPLAGHTRPNFPAIAAPMLPPSPEDALRSPWMVELPGAVLGFTAARTQTGVITVQPGRLVASAYAEGHRLAAGASLAAEPLRLFLGGGALAAYAGAAAREMGAAPPATAPTGWCSWYEFFADVDEAAMVRNLDVLVAERGRLPVEVVQLDDGYETAIGDWLSLNAKFPAGLRALTDRIHAAGFQAGIWVAPFIVASDSVVAREHPGWILRDAHGDPVAAIENWGRACWALDLTHPEVGAWLREVFGTIVGAWGFDYLKIDFIYAGALRGVRHEPGVSGVEAYRRGLALIREVAGDRFVLGCGAPFLPSLGLVDGMRVSPDTAPDWSHPDPQGSSPSLQNAIRATLAHHWMHGAWWVNDPDCLIVRDRDTRLTEAEVRTWATVVALSGGMVLLSDDLAALTPARAAILPRTLPPLGEAAVPAGPLTDGLPARLELPGLVAVFNWSDAPARLSYAPPAPSWLADLWTGETWPPAAGPVDLGETPPHGVRLLRVTAPLPHPQVVGSTVTLHGREVVSERWTDGTLTITLAWPGEHAGDLLITTPAGVIRHPVTFTDTTTTLFSGPPPNPAP